MFGRTVRSLRSDDVDNMSSLGFDNSTCEVDRRRTTLTKMPVPQLQQKPASTSSRMGLHSKSQVQSMFFSQLHSELRRQIYLSLFGNCRIHVEFDIGPSYHQWHGVQYQSRAPRWRWWHHVCNEPSKFFPKCAGIRDCQRDWCQHNEEESRNKKLMLRPASMKEHKLAGTSWLRSCWLGYVLPLPIHLTCRSL